MNQYFRPFSLASRVLLFAFVVAVLAPVANAQRDPDRPDIVELLPETTVAFVQIPDIRSALEKTMDGSAGKFLEDEAIAPLYERIVEETQKAYSTVEEDVGLSLDEWAAIPSGEMVFAAVAPRRKKPAFIVILEVGEDNEAADKAFDLAMDKVGEDEENEIEEAELESGAEVDKVVIDGTPVWIARREGLIIGCSNEKVLDDMFTRWDGGEVKKVRPLAKNRKFITIMNRCKSKKDLPIDFRFFFDPIALTKSAGRGDMGAQVAIAMFPAIGLDSILGMGGSVILDDDEYETIMHAHLLLSNPRKGVTKVISLKPDTYEPQTWVPNDAFMYMTTSWDVPQMYQELRGIFDLVLDEGTFDNFITENVDERLEMSLEDEILAQFNGRVSMTQVAVDPGKFNSGSMVFGMGLNNLDEAKETIDKIVTYFNSELNADLEEREYNGFTLWVRSDEAIEERNEQRQKWREERRKRRGDDKEEYERRDAIRNERMATMRVPRVSFGIVGESLVICDSIEAFEMVVETYKGEVEPLRNNEDFVRMSEQMTQLLGTDMPVAMSYSNPKHQFKPLLDYLNADSTKTFLSTSAEDSDFWGTVKGVLDDHELPSMEVMSKYMAPQGWFVTSDDTGYHMLWFQERLQLDD